MESKLAVDIAKKDNTIFKLLRESVEVKENVLDAKERKDLPDSDYAVVKKDGSKHLPIENADHVKMAWDMVDRTEGLSDSEKEEARKKILKKAKELGIDTADWDKKKNEEVEVKDYFTTLGEEGAFKKLVNKIVKSGKSKSDAMAIAASVGRKKYGTEKYDDLIKKGEEKAKKDEAISTFEGFLDALLEDVDPAFTGVTQSNSVGPYVRGGLGGKPENPDQLSPTERKQLSDLVSHDHEVMDKYRELANKVSSTSLKGHLSKEISRREGHMEMMAQLVNSDGN